MMTLDEYQEFTRETQIYEDAVMHTLAKSTQGQTSQLLCIMYPTLKINGEAGEIAEQVGKALRDDHGVITMERREKIIKEVGDILWYAARIADELNEPLSSVLATNVQKLRDRKDRGVLGGGGDER